MESLAINGRPLEPSENPAVKKRTSAPKKAFDATEGRRRPSDSILA
ncbi:conserved domain protein [Eggerthella sp. HGA1]|nr:conserved domain protein [Eggerthella sp. HGA1]